ncbi:MAG TPA: tetratricopeptide repeat protein [Anaeromyxobacteraceae bacterium]|nr:tetratricopeptide repeat protein [Anaeromyxobacteraceae bacterium]
MRHAHLLALALALPAPALAQTPPPPTPAEAAPAAAPRPDPSALLAEVDREWPQRDAPGAIDRIRGRLAEAEKLAPDDYGVLWRQSRFYFWLADDPALPKGEKSKLGKVSWEYGDRASRAAPARVEGWNYAAAGMGNYALGIGIFTALRQGIEGKFKERLGKATQIDPKFEHGAIHTAWGRFWYELPWPKYDAKKSRKALEEALAQNPDNVRARVYLADLAKKEDRSEEARKELEAAVANPPGRYDAPEERRWQAAARERLRAR